jgi:hypothetical protein
MSKCFNITINGETTKRTVANNETEVKELIKELKEQLSSKASSFYSKESLTADQVITTLFNSRISDSVDNYSVLENTIKKIAEYRNSSIQNKPDTKLYKELKELLGDDKIRIEFTVANLDSMFSLFKLEDGVYQLDLNNKNIKEFTVKFLFKDVLKYLNANVKLIKEGIDGAQEQSFVKIMFDIMSIPAINVKTQSSGKTHYFDFYGVLKSFSFKDNALATLNAERVGRIKHSPYVTIAHTKNNARLEDLKYNPSENKPASASSLNERSVIKTNESESDFKEVFKENEMLLDDPEVFNQGLEIKVEIVDNLNIPQTLNDVSSKNHTFTASQVATIKKIINDIAINNTNSVALESLEELDKILIEGVSVKDVLEQLRDLESILYADSVLKLNLPEELKLKYSNINFSQAIRPIVTAQNALVKENLSSDELFAITAGLIEGIKMKAYVDKNKKEFPNQNIRIRLSSEPLWYWDRRGTSEGGFRSSVAGMTTPHQNRTEKLDNTTSVYIPTEFILNTIIENNQPSNGNNNIVEIKDAFKNQTREFKKNDESTFINIGGIPFFAFQDNLGKKIYIPSIFHYRANANENNPNAVKNKLIDYIINTNLALLNTSDKKVEMELLRELQDLIQNVNFKSQSNNIGTYFLMPNKARGANKNVRFINSTSVSLGNDLDTFNDKNRLLDILKDETLLDLALSRFNHFLSFTKSDSLDNIQKIKATEAFLNSNRDTNAFITYVEAVFNTRVTDTVLNYKTSNNQDKSVELDIYTQMLTNVFSALDRYPLPSNSPGMFFHNPASFILDPNSIGFNIKEEQTKLEEEKFLKEKQESLKEIDDKQNTELEKNVEQNIKFRETNQPKTAEDFNAFVNNLFETTDVLKLSDSFNRASDDDNIEGFLKDNFNVYFAAEYLKNQSEEFIESFYENVNENLGDLILDNIDKLRSDANLFKRLEDYHYTTNSEIRRFDLNESYLETFRTLFEEVNTQKITTENAKLSSQKNLITDFIIQSDLNVKPVITDVKNFKNNFEKYLNSLKKEVEKNKDGNTIDRQGKEKSVLKEKYDKKISNIDNLLKDLDNQSENYFKIFDLLIKDYYDVTKSNGVKVYVTKTAKKEMEMAQYDDEASTSADNINAIRGLVKSLFSGIKKSHITSSEKSLRVSESDDFFGVPLYFNTEEILAKILNISSNMSFSGNSKTKLKSFISKLNTAAELNDANKYLYQDIKEILDKILKEKDIVKTNQFLSVINMVKMDYFFVSTKNGRTKINLGDTGMMYAYTRKELISRINELNIINTDPIFTENTSLKDVKIKRVLELLMKEEAEDRLILKDETQFDIANNLFKEFIQEVRDKRTKDGLQTFDEEFVKQLEKTENGEVVYNTFNNLLKYLQFSKMNNSDLVATINGNNYAKFTRPTTFEQSMRNTKANSVLLGSGFSINYITTVGKDYNPTKYGDLTNQGREILKLELAFDNNPKFFLRKFSDKSIQSVTSLNNKTVDSFLDKKEEDGKPSTEGTNLYKEVFAQRVKQELQRIEALWKEAKENNFEDLSPNHPKMKDGTLLIPTACFINTFPLLNNTEEFVNWYQNIANNQEPTPVKKLESLVNSLTANLQLEKLNFEAYSDFIKNETIPQVSFLTEIHDKINQLKELGVINVNATGLQDLFNVNETTFKKIKKIFNLYSSEETEDFSSNQPKIEETVITTYYDSNWNDSLGLESSETHGNIARKLIFDVAKYLVLADKAVNTEYEVLGIIEDSAYTAKDQKTLIKEKTGATFFQQLFKLKLNEEQNNVDIISFDELKKLAEEITKRYAKLSGGGDLFNYEEEFYLTAISADLKIKEPLAKELILSIAGTDYTVENGELVFSENYTQDKKDLANLMYDQFMKEKDATDAAQLMTTISAFNTQLANGFIAGNNQRMSVLKWLHLNERDYYEFRKNVQKEAVKTLKSNKKAFTIVKNILGKDTTLNFEVTKDEDGDIIIFQNKAELPFNSYFSQSEEIFKEVEKDNPQFEKVNSDGTKEMIPLTVVDLVLNPLKPMEASRIQITDTSTYVNYLKSAQFLVGSNYKTNNLLGQWREMSLYNNIHTTIFSSGIKQHLSDNKTPLITNVDGKYSINKDFFKFNKKDQELSFNTRKTNITINNYNYRFNQLNTQNDFKEKVALATQMVVSLPGGTPLNVPIIDKSGKNSNMNTVADSLYNDLSNLTLLKLKDFLKEFGASLLDGENVIDLDNINSKEDLNKIKINSPDLKLSFKADENFAGFKRFLLNVSKDDLDLEENLEIIDYTGEDGLVRQGFLKPLSSIRGLEFKLTSAFTKKVLNLKFPGLSTIQAPDVFTFEPSLELNEDNVTDVIPQKGIALISSKSKAENLKPIRLADANGVELNEAENSALLKRHSELMDMINNPLFAFKNIKDEELRKKGLYEAMKKELKELSENYTVLPAEIVVPFNFFDNNKNPLSLKDFTNEDGTLNTDLIDPDLLKTIGYRIPYQGPSSGYPFKIVGFTDLTEHGNMSIVPNIILVSMGSDFDVDKINLLFSNYNLSKNEKGLPTLKKLGKYDSLDDYLKTLPLKEKVKFKQLGLTEENFNQALPISKKSLENDIIDTFYNIYISPYYYDKVLTPQENKEVEDIKAKIKEREEKIKKPSSNKTNEILEMFNRAQSNSVNSSVFQSFITNNNMGAKKMLGIAVMWSQINAIGQRIGLYNPRPMYFYYGDKPITEDIGREFGDLNLNSILNFEDITQEDAKTFNYFTLEEEPENLVNTEGLYKLDKVYVKDPADPKKVYFLRDLSRQAVNITVDAANNQDPSNIGLTTENTSYVLQLTTHVPLQLTMDYVNNKIINHSLTRVENQGGVFDDTKKSTVANTYKKLIFNLVNTHAFLNNEPKPTYETYEEFSMTDITTGNYKADLEYIHNVAEYNIIENPNAIRIFKNLIDDILDSTFYNYESVATFINKQKLKEEDRKDVEMLLREYIGLIANLAELNDSSANQTSIMEHISAYRKGLDATLMENSFEDNVHAQMSKKIHPDVLKRLDEEFTGKSYHYKRLFNSLFADKDNTFTFESSELMKSTFNTITEITNNPKLSKAQLDLLRESTFNFLISGSSILKDVFQITENINDIKKYFNENTDVLKNSLIQLKQTLRENNLTMPPFLDKIEFTTGENPLMGLVYSKETFTQTVSDFETAYEISFENQEVNDQYQRFISNFLIYTLTTNTSMYGYASILPFMPASIEKKIRLPFYLNQAIHKFKNINPELEGEDLRNYNNYVKYYQDQILRNNPSLIGKIVYEKNNPFTIEQSVRGINTVISFNKENNPVNEYFKLYVKRNEEKQVDYIIYRKIDETENTFTYQAVTELTNDYNNTEDINSDFESKIIFNPQFVKSNVANITGTTEKAIKIVDSILYTLYEIEKTRKSNFNLLNIVEVGSYNKTTTLLEKYKTIRLLLETDGRIDKTTKDFIAEFEKKQIVNNIEDILSMFEKLVKKIEPSLPDLTFQSSGITAPRTKNNTTPFDLTSLLYSLNSINKLYGTKPVDFNVDKLRIDLHNLGFKYNNLQNIGNFKKEFGDILKAYLEQGKYVDSEGNEKIPLKEMNESFYKDFEKLLADLFYNKVNGQYTTVKENYYTVFSPKITEPNFYLKYRISKSLDDVKNKDLNKLIEEINLSNIVLNNFFKVYSDIDPVSINLNTFKTVSSIINDDETMYKKVKNNITYLINNSNDLITVEFDKEFESSVKDNDIKFKFVKSVDGEIFITVFKNNEAIDERSLELTEDESSFNSDSVKTLQGFVKQYGLPSLSSLKFSFLENDPEVSEINLNVNNPLKVISEAIVKNQLKAFPLIESVLKNKGNDVNISFYNNPTGKSSKNQLIFSVRYKQNNGKMSEPVFYKTVKDYLQPIHPSNKSLYESLIDLENKGSFTKIENKDSLKSKVKVDLTLDDFLPKTITKSFLEIVYSKEIGGDKVDTLYTHFTFNPEELEKFKEIIFNNDSYLQELILRKNCG